MDWIVNLFTQTDSVAHIVLLYAIVISVGVYLGKIKFFGISLGVTFVLFAGIVAGHFAFTAPTQILTFMQDFGLILFVFCIGLQVGPSFFSSFREGGVTMNLIAVGIVALNVLVMLALYYLCFDTSDPRNLPMMVGVLCGAITNTPGLGAATEALGQVWSGGTAPQIATGYACAYPLGVVGIILATLALKYICSINEEEDQLALQKEEENANPKVAPTSMYVQMSNAALAGKKLLEVKDMINRDFVCARIKKNGVEETPTRDTIFELGDQMKLYCAEIDSEAIVAFLGHTIDANWEKKTSPLVSRRILVTQSKMNGKSIGHLHFSSVYGVNITRVNRAGLDLFASQKLRLQVGDRVTVVGPEESITRVAAKLGDQMKRLDHPNIATIFVGILIGIVFGSIPIAFPGIPTPVKLGLAGGPLCVAILIGAYGYKAKLVTYTTMSANLMLREVGLALFLASVGIKAGANFLSTVVNGDGMMYVACGFLITILPILIMGTVARMKYKMNYYTLMGLIAGSTTDPPALAFANQVSGNDAPAVGYSTVYPLSMFLRILSAQLIILLLCGL